MDANRIALEEMTKSWQQRLDEAQRRTEAQISIEEQIAQSTAPCLKNLNEDPFLTGKLTFYLIEGNNIVGRVDSKPDIGLRGVGVTSKHATIISVKTKDTDDEEEEYYECTIQAHGKTMLNGEVLKSGECRELHHKDRLLFGNHNLFAFVDPTDVDKLLPDWGECMKEANKDSLTQYRQETEDGVETGFREIQAKLELEKEDIEKELNRLKEEGGGDEDLSKWEKRLKEVEEKLSKLEEEKQEERKVASKEKQARIVLEEVMTRTILLIEEANSMSDEMGKSVFFSMKLSTRTDPLDITRKTLTKNIMQNTDIQIRVEWLDTDVVQFWTLDLFERKMYDMREIYNEIGEGEVGGEDPFHSDPDAYHALGQAYLYLDPLRNLLPVIKDFLPIFDYRGSREGELVVSLQPRLGENNTIDLDDCDTVEDLKGQTLEILLQIENGSRLTEKYCRNPQVLFKWIDGSSTEYKCVAEGSNNPNPKFFYSKLFQLPINEQTIPWFDGALVFDVYGMASAETKGESGGGGGEERGREDRVGGGGQGGSVEDEIEEHRKVMELIRDKLNAKGISLDELLKAED